MREARRRQRRRWRGGRRVSSPSSQIAGSSVGSAHVHLYMHKHLVGDKEQAGFGRTRHKKKVTLSPGATALDALRRQIVAGAHRVTAAVWHQRRPTLLPSSSSPAFCLATINNTPQPIPTNTETTDGKTTPLCSKERGHTAFCSWEPPPQKHKNNAKPTIFEGLWLRLPHLCVISCPKEAPASSMANPHPHRLLSC